MIFFFAIYFIATEVNSDTTSTAEFLVFQRGHVPAYLEQGKRKDEEDPETAAKPANPVDDIEGKQEDKVKALPAQKDIFTWRNVTLDIKIKGEPRRLLDNISGYVKPGTLTALMGTSGAGKTTLLDALAQRTNIGVLTGDMVSTDLASTPGYGCSCRLMHLSARQRKSLGSILSTKDRLCAAARFAPRNRHSA